MFVLRLIAGIILNVIIFGGLLFVPAGTLEWWRAGVFLGVIVVAAFVTMVTVFSSRKDLLNERFKPPIQKGQPLADRIILLLF